MELINEDLAKVKAYQNLIELKEKELEELEEQYESEMIKIQARKILDEIKEHGEYTIFAVVPESKENIETIREKIKMTGKEIDEINKFFKKYSDDKSDRLLEKIN